MMSYDTANNILGNLALLGLMLLPVALLILCVYLLIRSMRRSPRGQVSAAFWLSLGGIFFFGYISFPILAFLIGCSFHGCAGF